MMPDIHPTSIGLAFPMKVTLIAWFVPVILLAAGAIEAKFRLNRIRTESELAHAAGPTRAAPSAAMPWAGGLS